MDKNLVCSITWCLYLFCLECDQNVSLILMCLCLWRVNCFIVLLPSSMFRLYRQNLQSIEQFQVLPKIKTECTLMVFVCTLCMFHSYLKVQNIFFLTWKRQQEGNQLEDVVKHKAYCVWFIPISIWCVRKM